MENLTAPEVLKRCEIYGKSPLTDDLKWDLVNAKIRKITIGPATIDIPYPKPPFKRIKYYELDGSDLIDLEELDKLEVVNKKDK